VITLGLVAAPMTVHFDLDQPVLKVAQAKSCFTGDTRILMADGRERPIREIRVGDLVMAPGDRANRVTGIERPLLGERLLYSINGGPHFVTAEHPLMTAGGWKAIDPAATAAEAPGLRVKRLEPGDCLTTLRAAGAPRTAGNLALAGLVLEQTVLLALEARAADPETPLFNLLLDGDHAYFADGYLVHNKGGGEGGGGGGGSDGGEGGSDGGEGGSDGGEGGEAGDDGAEGGEAGDDGAEAGEAGEAGEADEAGEAGNSGPGSPNSGPGSANSGPGNAHAGEAGDDGAESDATRG
jgi:hypothetical protein